MGGTLAALVVTAVTASASDSNKPAGAIDNDPLTRWSAYGDGQWLRVDLGQAQTVMKISFSTARYVRVVGHGATGTRWTSLTRLAVIG